MSFKYDAWFFSNNVLEFFFCNFNLLCNAIHYITLLFWALLILSTSRLCCILTSSWSHRLLSLLYLFHLNHIFLIPSWDPCIWINNLHISVPLFLLFLLRLHLRVTCWMTHFYPHILDLLLYQIVLLQALTLLSQYVIPVAWHLAHQLVRHYLLIGDCLS